jgi:single-stranded-DNA-specific exonuclease
MKNVPWIAGPAPDPQVVKRLVDDAGLSPLVASLLVRRGITTREDAIMFIHPEYSELHNPALMADMLKAAERLQSAVEDGERILVYGDYDVDGTTAVALVASFLDRADLCAAPVRGGVRGQPGRGGVCGGPKHNAHAHTRLRDERL